VRVVCMYVCGALVCMVCVENERERERILAVQVGGVCVACVWYVYSVSMACVWCVCVYVVCVCMLYFRMCVFLF
jgi:hypothetical protein